MNESDIKETAPIIKYAASLYEIKLLSRLAKIKYRFDIGPLLKTLIKKSLIKESILKVGNGKGFIKWCEKESYLDSVRQITEKA
ncbi:MAG: hypothetical protein GF347_01525 [Candidatus Moranbacteria bacterium]|nr:hypothetical protein [Candidatus Moranbacteria bacterium]